MFGGAGRDTLIGGAGADQFYLVTVAEAGNGSLRDVIRHFQTRVDDIDLSLMDANTVAAGSQAFRFIGAAAFPAAGQMRYAGGTLAADFQIALTGAPVLVVGNVIF